MRTNSCFKVVPFDLVSEGLLAGSVLAHIGTVLEADAGSMFDVDRERLALTGFVGRVHALIRCDLVDVLGLGVGGSAHSGVSCDHCGETGTFKYYVHCGRYWALNSAGKSARWHG